MFDELCSIYADALDNEGRYVDMSTGECIQCMTIRDFCLTDRWKDYVLKLRALRIKYGESAKSMPEYAETKKQLPGATLSGLFSLYPDECVRSDGSRYIKTVSRRETHLEKHTGWLAIDIDVADNEHLASFDNIKTICKFRPEIALLMHSCSGTGYFGLVRLAYPDKHREQFNALIREYAAIGITLDKQCGNIGRVRFASWDEPEHIYINDSCVPYQGLYQQNESLLPLSSSMRYKVYSNSNSSGISFWDNPKAKELLVESIVGIIAGKRINIAESYDDWIKVGWALKAHPMGESLFHSLSRCSAKYNPSATSLKWSQLGDSKTVSYNYLIHVFKELFGENVFKGICSDVRKQMK